MATTITANGINFPDGSASSPSIGGSDTNTGLFTGADIIGFSTGGSERLRIDSDGRLLLGTTTPGNSTADDLTIATSSNTGITLRSATNGEGNIFFGDGTSGADQYRGMVRYFHNDDALAFNAAGSERMRIDSSGNVMIGASSASGKFHVEHSGENNVYFIGNTSTSGARLILQNKNTTANSFTGLLGADAGGQTTSQILFYNADNANNEGFITFETRPSGGLPAERMRITSAGYVYLGNGFSTPNHRINGDGKTQGQTFLTVSAYNSSSQDTAIFFGVNVLGGNTASCGILVGKNSTNNRSINAGGTINASGSDYAEYMTKSGDFTLSKGDICGINAEGKLTNKFSESISFVVKSTDPSYVGGDSWGGEDILGEKPADDSSDLPAYELKMEAARKLVDRIAFSGQVPVNVTGTTAGQHIIPTEGSGDTITGVAKTEASLSMAEYMSSVGKVITLESDGRARIIVKVC
jgi:hypothetical protein